MQLGLLLVLFRWTKRGKEGGGLHFLIKHKCVVSGGISFEHTLLDNTIAKRTTQKPLNQVLGQPAAIMRMFTITATTTTTSTWKKKKSFSPNLCVCVFTKDLQIYIHI